MNKIFKWMEGGLICQKAYMSCWWYWASLLIISLWATFCLGFTYSDKQICDAIYIIEGKEKARQAFGIETVECKTYDKCEEVCLNTVRNNKARFLKQNEEKDFLIFLAKRYCPPNWEVWLKNLKFYLERK